MEGILWPVQLWQTKIDTEDTHTPQGNNYCLAKFKVQEYSSLGVLKSNSIQIWEYWGLGVLKFETTQVRYYSTVWEY